MALQKDRKKFTIADVAEASFPRPTSRVMQTDGSGNPIGRANVKVTKLELTFAVPNAAGDEQELFRYPVPDDVLAEARRKAMLAAAAGALSAAEKTALVDAAWAAYLKQQDATEV